MPEIRVKLSAVNIRRMTKDDVRSILDMDRRVVGKDRVASWPQKATSHLETYYPPLCHVAEVEGKVVGFILGDIRGAEFGLPLSGWIDIMGVDPLYQGQGIGRLLVEAFVEECHQNGIRPRLIIREKDERIMKFFTSLGFHRGELIDLEK